MDMFNATVPVFDRMLGSMQAWIGIAREHARGRVVGSDQQQMQQIKRYGRRV